MKDEPTGAPPPPPDPQHELAILRLQLEVIGLREENARLAAVLWEQKVRALEAQVAAARQDAPA